MTDFEAGKAVILAAGPLNAAATGPLAARFDLHRIAKADVALIPDRLAGRVRGLAVQGSAGAEFFAALPALEICASFGVGYDAIAVRAAAGQGVVVTNTPDVLTEEVADTTLGLLISAVRELPQAERYLRAGKWLGQGAYPLTRGSLRGRSVGIFGLGRIGQAIARRIEAFGLPVSYHSRRPVAGVSYRHYDSLLGLAAAVDTLICVAPGTGTEKAIDAAVLRALGPEGVLINVGRGTTVDEPALIAALQGGQIMAAGLDVFADEPRVPQALLDLPNVVVLPHVGSASVQTRDAMGRLVADNLIAWFEQGRPLTPVPETPVQAKPMA